MRTQLLQGFMLAGLVLVNQIIGMTKYLTKVVAFLGMITLFVFIEPNLQPEDLQMLAFTLPLALYYGYANYVIERARVQEFLNQAAQNETIAQMGLERVENLVRVNEFKDLVLASVTHDLRTPILTTQLQIRQVLEGQQLCARDAEALRIALKNCDRLIYQIADLLDYTNYAKFQKIRVSPRFFTTEELVKDLRDIFEHQCEIKGLQLRIDCEGLAPTDHLFTDQTRLMQVLINFISNSLKFTRHGFVRLLLRCETEKATSPNRLCSRRESRYGDENESAAEELLEFCISDSGIGMSERQVSRLFEFYVSFDKNAGHGLGLALAKKMIGALGTDERIEVESLPNSGTSFRFRILRYLNRLEVLIPDEYQRPSDKGVVRSSETTLNVRLDSLTQHTLSGKTIILNSDNR